MNKALLSFSLATLLGFPVWAQQQDEDPADAAEHAAARLSFLNGSASLARGNSADAPSAIVNTPLVTGDRLITSGNGRAEVEFDAANFLRLAPGTDVRMGDLRYERYLIQVAQGLVSFRVVRESSAQVEISMPNSSLRPLRPGLYRVLVRPDGTSEISIRSGQAEIFSPGGSETIDPGVTLLSRGPIDNPEFMTVQAIPNDDWDRFNADRDRVFERYTDVPRYGGADVAGMEDLNGYGRWVYDPGYGNVWVPTVNSDWTPYQDGRWDSLDYYGWTWVSYDPWGWAPYHYGRWYRGSWGWAWYPGFSGPRHYFRPALVGFVGWGSPGFGSSFGFGFGNVGWVPLAPREAFRPWYGRGFVGGGSVAVFNAAGTYHNARFNAVTGVSANDFGHSNRYFRPAASDVLRAGIVGAPLTSAHVAVGGASPQGAAGAHGRQTQFYSSPAVNSAVQPGGWRRVEAAPQATPVQPVRISPPIVTNRMESAPRNNYAPNFGGFGGSGSSQPRYSPPAVQRTPSSGGGGVSRGPQGGGHSGGNSHGGGRR